MNSRAFAGALLGSLLGACTFGDRSLIKSGTRAELVGCYDLFGPGGRLLDSSYYNASPGVYLTRLPIGPSDRDTLPGIVRMMVRLDETPRFKMPSPFGPAWWADSLTDSVYLSFQGGFSGAILVLAAPPTNVDTLRGRIFEAWDFGPPFTTSKASSMAIRRTCPPDLRTPEAPP